MRLFALALSLLLLGAHPAFAQDEEDYANAGIADLSDDQRAKYLAAEEAYNDGDYAKARQLLKSLTDERIGAAWWLMGVLDFQGLGGPKDEEKSRNDFIEAARSGSAYYQTSLADLYREGTEPFKKDCDQAERWYNQAMMRGNQVAKDRAGLLRVCRGEPLTRNRNR